ncbi:hypothetical protein WICANDRAFT_77460 [Wickerhamomyces anomalus NRRL Y-366-8]|uniref:PH domain-containing protein n=1 Tax=Wickerhamomyces anomalus (strain ATCC 58044 / CBS 1984 / NCYC 433 / NRRL Y-366-8) TaxID=683960 RepID=A0A1E3P7D3_WICAA|nr:uncharacterized protein WICANDRAFT_77460 [Wickerhamomyces anomalus NRRL Y-366-8]ODQ60787.1 hypothetical protein WICANDRAFT_77460 [Wickerhamomyces anomalus NRRL Y-366-8]
MTTPPSAKSIEQAFEKQKAKGKYLEESVSLQFLNDLKAHITNQSPDKFKSIILLSHVIRSSKPNELFVNVLDETLLNGILGSITKSTTVDYIMATFRILLIMLKGEIFNQVDPSEYLNPLLRSLNSNLLFLDVLSTKLYTENVDLILKSLEFINGYFSINHYQLYSLNYLIKYFLKLQKSEYFIILNNILQDQRFKQILSPSIKKLNESLLKILNTLNEIKVDQHNILQLSMIEETSEFAMQKDHQSFIINNFSILQLIDFYFFSQSSNITFKKSFHEQMLFNNNKSEMFPLIPVSQRVTTLLLAIFQTDQSTSFPILKQYLFLRDLLHFNIISKFLEIWKESGAQQDELQNLSPLVEILLKHLNDELNDELHVVDQILTIFKTTNYSKLREIQLNNYKNENLSKASLEIQSFDKILKNQVFEFIKNQRFLQLSKGAWVFADLPTFNTSDQSTTPDSNFYFMILSPNFKNLLYKEYKFKTQNIPNIDKIGTPIQINSIANFKIEEIQQVDPTAIRTNPSESSRLINLVGKTIINKITLINRKGKVLFTFYAKKHDSFNYLDGLNLLLGHYDKLSDDLNFQIDKLFEIRKTVQLLNYDVKIDNNVVDDEQIYDLENLEKLSTNFYYS